MDSSKTNLIEQNEKTEHNWAKVSLLLSTILLYLIMVGFNALASTGSSQRINSFMQITVITYLFRLELKLNSTLFQKHCLVRA